MASNYPIDPKGAPYATPQSGPDGAVPGSSPPAGAQSPAVPVTENGAAVAHRRLTAGTMLSAERYKIEKLVAAGGMGAVYRAIDTRFNRPCAVKEMLDEFRSESERAQAVEWFSREATLLLDLNHPCIPRVRDFFTERSKYYLVMDLIKGHTLADMLDIQENVVEINGVRGITELRARDWTRQMCGVLSYLHRQ